MKMIDDNKDPFGPTTATRCNECEIIDAKCLIWSEESNELGGFDDMLGSLMPMYKSENEIINRLRNDCSTMINNRIASANAYLHHVQKRLPNGRCTAHQPNGKNNDNQ